MDREKIAGITPEQIRAVRLRAHHLDRKLPPGARDGIHPTFTSFRRWTGHMPAVPTDAEKRLVQEFLHAHGPADVSVFGAWLGCCPQQAKRLWQTAVAEMEPVRVAGRTRYVLAEDLEALRAAGGDADAWRLLGPHDPYLDFRDRALLLEDVKRQRAVWQRVSNPGVLLRGGRVAGVWRQKLQKNECSRRDDAVRVGGCCGAGTARGRSRAVCGFSRRFAPRMHIPGGGVVRPARFGD